MNFAKFSYGDLLLSLNVADGQLLTTWHKIEPDEAFVNNRPTGVYYMKIKKGEAD